MDNVLSHSGPWHAGELALQRLVGSEPGLRDTGPRIMRPFLTAQLQAFFPQLPFVVAAAVDRDGWPWVSVLEGPPGFVRPADEHHLALAPAPCADDPLQALLQPGAPWGLLGIELHTRRRNRVNGQWVGTDQGLALRVKHAYGNCPQYIHDWSAMWADHGPAGAVLDVPNTSLPHLPPALLAHIDRAPVAFVGSYARTDQGIEVDASHRGGRPGFIRRQGERLIIPDFSGNRFFNTLGNLLASGRAALVIPDFDSGDVLHLSGEAQLIDEAQAGARYPGAERYWCLTPRHARWRPSALRWRSRAGAPAVDTHSHGPWQALPANRMQQARVARVVRETDHIHSFYLQGDGLARFQAGQFITVRVPQLDGTPLMRSYTLSGDSRQRGYRISVKAQGSGSRYLQGYLKAGAALEVSAPSGTFTRQAAASAQADWVLLAGGIGITPLLSLAHELTGANGGPVTLIQSVRQASEAPFGDELRALEARGLRWLRHATAADTAVPTGWAAGRVALAPVLAGRQVAQVQLYLCGPASFVEHYQQQALALGLKPEQVHTEAFGPSSLGAPTPTGPAAEHGVEVRFASAQAQARWQPGETLLDTAERAGLQPPYGCRSGVCGQCACSLLQGEVTYPSALSVPAGQVLLCSARPAASSTTVEIDL